MGASLVCLTYVSPSLFHSPGISTWLMCIGASHACTASQCDLRDPGWGDPGFRHCDLFCFGTTRSILVNVVGLFCLFFNGWPTRYVAHKLSFRILFTAVVGLFGFVFFCLGFCCFVSLVSWRVVFFLMTSVERHHMTSMPLCAHKAYHSTSFSCTN